MDQSYLHGAIREGGKEGRREERKDGENEGEKEGGKEGQTDRQSHRAYNLLAPCSNDESMTSTTQERGKDHIQNERQRVSGHTE